MKKILILIGIVLFALNVYGYNQSKFTVNLLSENLTLNNTVTRFINIPFRTNITYGSLNLKYFNYTTDVKESTFFLENVITNNINISRAFDDDLTTGHISGNVGPIFYYNYSNIVISPVVNTSYWLTMYTGLYYFSTSYNTIWTIAVPDFCINTSRDLAFKQVTTFLGPPDQEVFCWDNTAWTTISFHMGPGDYLKVFEIILNSTSHITNPALEIGDVDGTPEWNYTGQLNINNPFVESNISHYYSFNDGTNDLRGSKDGTITNATPTGGYYGSGYLFDRNGFINLSTATDVTELTYCAWINWRGSGLNYVITSQKSNVGYRMWHSGGIINCNIRDAATSVTDTSTSTALVGEWFHGCCTYKDDDLKIYFNGVLEKEVTAGGSIGSINGGADVFIGNWADDTTSGMNGSIDEVMLYNRTLTESEILQIYNGQVIASGLETKLNTIINSCDCTNCSVTEDLCQIPYRFYSLNVGVLEYSGINTTYGYDFELNNCSRGVGSINFTVANESNTEQTFINTTIEGSFDYYIENSIDGTINKNYSFSVISNTSQVCIFPEYVNVTSEFQILYTFDSIGYNYFQAPLVLTNITKYVTLLVTSGDTTQITFNVKDTGGNDLQNAFLTIQKYDVGTNTYQTVEVIRTDTQGFAYARLILNTEYYRIKIFYDGVERLVDGPTIFISSTKNYIIDIIGDDLVDTYAKKQGISFNLTFNNDTKNFRCTYDDPSLSISEACLIVTRLQLSNMTQLQDTCTVSQSGTILGDISPVFNDTTWEAVCYVKYADGIQIILATLQYENLVNWRIWQSKGESIGVFMAFLIVVAMVLLGSFHPVGSIVLGLIGLSLSVILGLVQIAKGWVISLIIVGAIIIWRIGRR